MTLGTPVIPTPWRLRLRRWQYQLVPVFTMLIAAVLAGWLWARSANTVTATGEVNAVRVRVETKAAAMLEPLPRPVHEFDTVKDGQVVARLDLSAAEKQLERLRLEQERLRSEIGAGKSESAAQAAIAANPILVQLKAQIAELQSQLDGRELRASIDGTIVQIRQRPGQFVNVGSCIMIVAADKGQFIVAYVREQQRFRPAVGMSVIVRPRSGSRSASSFVQSVGPQVEPMPARYLRNPVIPEWAIPVQIAMPPELDLKPGELLDLTFVPSAE